MKGGWGRERERKRDQTTQFFITLDRDLCFSHVTFQKHKCMVEVGREGGRQLQEVIQGTLLLHYPLGCCPPPEIESGIPSVL